MCGIAGYTGPQLAGVLEAMINAVRARGPDGTGTYKGRDFTFGHTRLAIIDVCGGAQPLTHRTEKVTVSYNGEIYNYDELRRALEQRGAQFRTRCDTEIIPAAYCAHGVDFVRSLNGMFAFALADERSGEIILARDQFGIKPLYYAVSEGVLVFSSSARAVALHPAVGEALNPDSVRDFLQFRYVPSGAPLYAKVKVFPPGHVGVWRDGRLTLKAYWKPKHQVADTDAEEWIEEFTSTMSDAVRRQLRSDVPVGILLSGGVDSTAVAHFVAQQGEAPTAFTFAIGDETDESARAAEIARRYGLPHHLVSLQGGAANLDHLYDAFACMDVPVGDAIILPTWLLCREVAKSHKMVLTGEGADELFGGYVHYPVLRKLDVASRRAGWLASLAPLVRLVPVGAFDPFFDYQASLGSMGRDKIATILGALHRRALLPRLVTSIIDDFEIMEATNLPPPDNPECADLSSDGILRDGLQHWLPNQILNKMDQLSMAHGLEARVPFLDMHVFDLVASTPPSLARTGFRNKRLLRLALERAKVRTAWRPKHAFHLPVETSHRAALSALCRNWLSDEQVNRHGILKAPFVQTTMAQLDRGEFLASKRLVAMAGLHMWLDSHGAAL